MQKMKSCQWKSSTPCKMGPQQMTKIFLIQELLMTYLYVMTSHIWLFPWILSWTSLQKMGYNSTLLSIKGGPSDLFLSKKILKIQWDICRIRERLWFSSWMHSIVRTLSLPFKNFLGEASFHFFFTCRQLTQRPMLPESKDLPTITGVHLTADLPGPANSLESRSSLGSPVTPASHVGTGLRPGGSTSDPAAC